MTMLKRRWLPLASQLGRAHGRRAVTRHRNRSGHSAQFIGRGFFRPSSRIIILFCLSRVLQSLLTRRRLSVNGNTSRRASRAPV
jgi:hypothetical protein